MKVDKNVEIIGQYGATLSIIEVGLGSMLHALHIPMSGSLLSLNQGYILCRAAITAKEQNRRSWVPYNVSNVAAVLKSLSPAGKKLGPMLSLSMQGLLFNSGTFIFGVNPIGLSAGMITLSVWTFLQPIITYYLFFGEKLFTAAEYLYKKTLPFHKLNPENLFWIFLLLVITKMIVACALAIIAWRRKNQSLYVKNFEEDFHRFAKEKMSMKNLDATTKNPVLLAVKDLARPMFLISLAMTALFLYFTNNDNSQIALYLIRPIAIGFIFFYISRTLTLDRWLVKIEDGRLRSFSLGCQTALAKIRTFV